MSIPDNAVEKIAQFTSQLSAIEVERETEAIRLRLEYRQKMEPLFIERQAKLAENDGFWSGILSSPETPLAQLLNSTIDPKLARAVIALNVLSSVKDNKLFRKVVITLRPNIFAEEGEIFREVDSEMNTTGLKAIQWKKGTERARSDSLFSFFDEKPVDGEDFISEALESFDTVFQDPFLATESD